MKRLIVFGLLIVLLSACAPNPTNIVTSEPVNPDQPVTSETPSSPGVNNPYAPQPGDAALTRASAFINSADLLFMESFPVQVALILRGNLPTPCHNLRALIHAPDENNNIEVEVYSVADPTTLCVQVLQSFEANVPMGSFPSGHYTVTVNGQRVGEFDT